MPRRVRPGQEVLAGFISTDGSIEIRVTRAAGESSAAQIVRLVEDASRAKSRTDQFITRFARVYTPLVVAAAALVAFLPPLLVPGASLPAWIYRALTMLVISCPCALVVSIPLGYFGGVGGASRHGILVKGATYLDVLARVKTVVFDKTGTLTQGSFRVTVGASPQRRRRPRTFCAMPPWRRRIRIIPSPPPSARPTGGPWTAPAAADFREVAGRG